MFTREAFRDLLNYILVVGLFILAFIIIKPIAFPILYGLLLAYILYPIYKFILKKVKNKNFAASIMCFSSLVVLGVIVSLILGTIFNQVIQFYLNLQKVNLGAVIKKPLTDLLISPEIAGTISSAIQTSLSSFLAKFTSIIGETIVNFPVILLQTFVFFLIFYFSLRDGEDAFEYIKSLSPLKKEIQVKFSKNFKDITNSVLLGQIVVGILQGLIAGIGYFIFGVPNALLLTILTILIGVIPIIGPWLVWIPVDIYLFVANRPGAGMGLFIYGMLLINWVDTIVRPMIVSRRTQINPGIILVGMIGGLFVFGLLGLIIGPLILAYVLLVLEIYRKQSIGDSLIFKKMDDYNLLKNK